MCRFIPLVIIALSLSFSGHAKSPDKQIVRAINAHDWFALDSIYNATPKGSIPDFLDVFSRCLIGNRFNRPDVSIPAFAELLNNHSQKFNVSEIVTYAKLFSIDLSRAGDNAKASSIISSVLDSKKRLLNSEQTTRLEHYTNQYNSLLQYNPYTITFNGQTGDIPFRILPVGKAENKGVHMHLENSYINGISADITFDTGAPVNVISDSLANELNLIPLDVQTMVKGFGVQSGTLAVAKELKIGNLTINDVPFYVMDITANNAEANQYMKSLKIIVGSELMLQLKDMTIDFFNSRIFIPAEAPRRTETAPNLCFSSNMNLVAKGAIHNNTLLMCIDTGNASYGSLGHKFYKKNKKYIKPKGEPTIARMAGIGGVSITECYKVPDMDLCLGGKIVTVPDIDVLTKTNPIVGGDCNIGLKSLMLFKKVRFNLVDFVISTTEYSGPSDVTHGNLKTM